MATISSPSRADRDARRRSVAGAAVGVAVTGAIIAASSAGFVDASHAAWAVLAGCGVTVVLLGMVSTGRWALATAERNGARLATDMGPAAKGAR